jgi:hypothetical protein
MKSSTDKSKPTADPRPGAAAAPARHGGKVKPDTFPANHPGHVAAEESEYQRINIPDSRKGAAPGGIRTRDDRTPKKHH